MLLRGDKPVLPRPVNRHRTSDSYLLVLFIMSDTGVLVKTRGTNLQFFLTKF